MDLGLRLEIKEGRHCGSRPFMFTLHRENVLCQYNLIGDLYWSFYPKPEPLIKYSGPCFTTFGYSLIVTGDWKKVSNISTFYAKCHHNTILVACQSIHLKQIELIYQLFQVYHFIEEETEDQRRLVLYIRVLMLNKVENCLDSHSSSFWAVSNLGLLL